MDGKGTGIHWISGRCLEDLEYANDLTDPTEAVEVFTYLGT